MRKNFVKIKKPAMTKEEAEESMALGIFERIELGLDMLPTKKEIEAYKYYKLM